MPKKQNPIDTKSEDFQKLLLLQKRHNNIVSALNKLSGELCGHIFTRVI